MTALTRGIAPSANELRALSAAMETHTPQEILRWAVDTYGSGLTMATAFGAEGCVLLAMLSEIPGGLGVRVFNLDTGYQFPETLEVRERIREKYGIEVELVRPTETVAEMEARFGGPIYAKNPDECCRRRKIVPLRQTLAGYDAWVSAIRRDQTPDRAQANIAEQDRKFGIVKISPLANWTKRDVWTYILARDVPYNPLHDQGYPSIGCWPCTRAARNSEDDRSGRWTAFAKTECGLHVR